MSERPSMTLKARFRIFKRDGFTCGYCGRQPPAVVLEVDHVVPVSKGGTSDSHNLVTSCFDCNRGKSNEELSLAPDAISEQMARRAELEAQVKAFSRMLRRERKKASADIVEFAAYWYAFFLPQDKARNYSLLPDRSASVKRFLKDLPVEELLEAADIAHGRHPVEDWKIDETTGRLEWTESVTWKYFCGICWRKIRKDGRHE